MTKPLSEFRLGIIGGCLSHQAGIPHSKLYHQQIASNLKANHGMKLKVKISRGFELNYHDRLMKLVEEDALDGVLIHLRITFIGKIGILASYTVEGKRHYVVHPFLFNRKKLGAWPQLEIQNFYNFADVINREVPAQDIPNAPMPESRGSRVSVRDLNHIAGILLGLDKWAIRDELVEFDRFRQICAEKGVPFIVMGPTPTNSPVKNYLAQKFDNVLESKLENMAIPFCRLDKKTKQDDLPELHRDGIHLTVNGHRSVAEQLYPVMSAWIEGIKL